MTRIKLQLIKIYYNLMLSNTILFYIIIIVIAEGIAQTCLKEYSESKKIIYFLTGLICYGLVSWFLCES